MEKGVKVQLILVGLIVITLVLIIMAFLSNPKYPLTGEAIFEPPSPLDCSNESIKTLWNSIFKESSEGATILVNESLIFEDACMAYSAYKINGNELNMLSGMNFWFFVDMEMIMAINGKFTEEFLENISKIGSYENSAEIGMWIGQLNTNLSLIEDNLKPRNITTIQKANDEFVSKFKITPKEWETNLTENIRIYGFAENETIDLETKISAGIVAENYILNYYLYTKFIFPNITEISKNLSSVTTKNIQNLSLKINETKFDSSNTYTGKQKIKFLEGNQTIIEADWDFSKELNFSKINIEKQDNSSELGYLIVNGLNASKKIFLDKLDSSSKAVCIKNIELNSIQEISSGCDSTEEYLTDCPGSKNGFTCNITNNKFIVSGLTNSGVIEFIKECVPNWNCTSWTNQEQECGMRSCIDLNNCEDNSTKPSEIETCPCIPDWECTNFEPKKCPKEEKRTRTCVDINDCGTAEGRPSLNQSCTRESKLNWIYIAIIIVIVSIVILVIVLIKIKNKTKAPEYTSPQQNPRYQYPPQ